MAKLKRAFPITLIIAAAMLIVAVFACAFIGCSVCFGVTDGNAAVVRAESGTTQAENGSYILESAGTHSESGLQFTISTEEGYNWKLLLDGEVVEEFTGDWAKPPQSNVASVVFESKIKRLLASSEQDSYTLTFDLPDVAYTVIGSTTFDYTESEAGGIVIRGVYAPAISQDITCSLQYKSGDSGYATYGGTEQNGGLAFGKGVDVGSYDVRFAVFERFIYDGKEYRVARYSAPVHCTVTAAHKDAPDMDGVSVEYGTRVGDIASTMFSSDGIWILSDEQDIEIEAETLLVVKDGFYSLKFDFIHNNPNYKKVEGIVIPVTVTPRTLRVYISDAFSIVGEPLVEDISYEVTTPLIGDDSIEDLGVSIYVDGGDGSTAGRFAILAKFENRNYEPECKSYQNPLLVGGTYTVFETTLTAVAPDGVEFTVFISGGFENMILRVELADISITPNFISSGAEKYEVIAAYILAFENSDGERVFPEEDCLLRLSDYGGATHCSTADGLYEISENGMLLDSAYGVLYLCKKIVKIQPIEITLAWVNLALGIFSCVLAAAFIALVAVYAKVGRK